MTIFNSFSAIKNFIPNRTLQLGSAFGNSGYFGIPVSLALLPNHALIYSIGFDLGATLVIWSIGPILLWILFGLLILIDLHSLANLVAFQRLQVLKQLQPLKVSIVSLLIVHSMERNEQLMRQLILLQQGC